MASAPSSREMGGQLPDRSRTQVAHAMSLRWGMVQRLSHQFEPLTWATRPAATKP